MRLPHTLRKDPLGWCIIAALALLVVIAVARPARAHEWYPRECCSEQDCAPVTDVSFVAADVGSLPVMIVTTKFGTKPLAPETKVASSKDSRMHACIYQGKLLCLFLPPGQ
jgi:hypothetical protein